MKVCSSIFVVALAATASAPTAKAAACQAVCGTDTCQDQAIAAGASVPLSATSTTCSYGKQYLRALTVSEASGADLLVAFSDGTNTVTATATASESGGSSAGSSGGSCYLVYADVGKDASLRGDVTASVSCSDANAACTIKYDATWMCQRDPALCAVDCVDCTDTVLGMGESLHIAKPTEFNCGDVAVAFPWGLTVGAKYNANGVVVSFNNGLTPNKLDSLTNCQSAYDDVVGTEQIRSDVVVTVTCVDGNAVCTAQHKVVEWACYMPPDLGWAWTRANSTGDCPPAWSCDARCTKSMHTGQKALREIFVPALDPDGCDCRKPILSATVKSDGVTTYDEATNMTTTWHDNQKTFDFNGTCVADYKAQPFTNPFNAFYKKYSLRSVEPSQCIAPDDCHFRCTWV